MEHLRPTAEQQSILDAAASGGTVAISAAAGSGKTSTLRMIAAARPKTRFLYVSFNRAIQQEAAGTFPPNVTCKTAHSLAYARFGAQLRRRLNGPRMTGVQNARVLGITTAFGLDAERIFEPRQMATMAMGMVASFCRSAEAQITPRHFVPPEGLTHAEATALATHLLPFAKRAWADLTAGEAGKLKPTHDVYLKQWQLSDPQLTGWSCLMFDEAQDSDPCIASVVERQGHAQLIAVGDSAQAIYGWRGAGDFLARVHADHRLALTQSWRFGQAIADEANAWLDVIRADLRVVGNPARDSRLDTLETPDTVLCRSNAGTIEVLLAAHDTGVKVHLVGDGKEMLALAAAAARLQVGKPAGHPELVAFTSWEEVVEYAQHDPGGSDLAIAVRMIERYGAQEIIRAVDGAVPAGRADLCVSTAHKAKGLEWDRVRIACDFHEPIDKRTGELLPIPPADAMLAYVAVTRAKTVLDNAGLAWVHPHLEALAEPDRTGPAQTAPSSSSLPDGANLSALSAASTEVPIPVAATQEDLDGRGLGVGAEIRVADERGIFIVRGVAKDGSLLAYRSDGAGGARNFQPEWCAPATRPGCAGRPVKVRSVPAAARAARAAWRAEHVQPNLETKDSEPLTRSLRVEN